MPVNLHNISAFAQESGNDKIPGLWQYLSLQGSRDRGLALQGCLYLISTQWQNIVVFHVEVFHSIYYCRDVLNVADKNSGVLG